MQFTRAIPFQEAIDKLGERSVVGSKLKSAAWAEVPLALRERAYFSSTVESVRVLQRGKDALGDFLSGARQAVIGPDGVERMALATGSRQQFVKDMQEFMRAEGIIRQHGGVTDVASQRRLELIFDTQTRQAQDFGAWKQGQDPDVLDEFPAQRFIRVQGVQSPRDAHAPFEDAVRLKSDLDFWTRLNEDFGVPWGPWGWGCGHDVEDVDREEAQALGLIKPNEHARPIEKDFNDRLAASTRGLDADLQRALKEAFGDQVVIDGDEARWAGQPKGSTPTNQPNRED